MSPRRRILSVVGTRPNMMKIAPIAELNALNVLQPRKMLVTKEALDAFKARVPETRSRKGN